MKRIFLFVFILLSIILIYSTQNNHVPTAIVDGHKFTIDIAKSPRDQQIGLAKYTSIKPTHGMYFPFEKPDYYTFWMKDMHFPIDIIFIQNNKIVTIFSNVPIRADYKKYIYQPTSPATAVLELSAGTAKKYGLKNGDTVYLHI